MSNTANDVYFYEMYNLEYFLLSYLREIGIYREIWMYNRPLTSCWGGHIIVINPEVAVRIIKFKKIVRVAVVHRSVTRMTPLCLQSFWWPRRFQTCVLVGKFSWYIKSTEIQSVVQYRICPGVTFGLGGGLMIYRFSIIEVHFVFS